jgi:hypothetical protein
MATSYGPGPARLVPPPTPDSLVNKAALAGLVFSTDPKKFRTYTLQFKSAIGAQYKVTLERAIATGDFGPTSTAAIVLHAAIYDMLVLTFKGEDDILDEMIAQCNADGPACFAYLESKYNSTSLPAAVKNLGAIVREPIVGPEQIAGVVALNKRYSRLCFTDEQLTALIILKLPDKYSTIKTLILQSDRLPTVAELMHKLQAEVDFEPDSDTPAVFSAVAGQQPAGFCFNCDMRGHTIRSCPSPKVTCGECGDKGHLDKHCWIRNDKPLPFHFDDAKKQRIEVKRIAYKATAAAAMTTAVGGYCEAEQIREDESFLDAMQRLYSSS